MTHSKPIHSLNIYGSFGFRLDREAVEHRKRLTERVVKPPLQWDLVKEGLDIFAVRSERKCVELEAEQARMKVDVREQKKLNEFRLEEVHRLLQGDIHQQFIAINAFVRECAAKEQKATERIQEEEQRQQQLTNSILSLEQDLQQLLEFKGRMDECVEEFQCYEETVAQLVAQSEHISTTKDFMDKCDALMLAQVEISEMEVQKVREVEEFQRRLVKLGAESETDLLGLTNCLVELDKAYERAQSQGIRWEQVLVQSRDVIVAEEVQFSRILDSARQLFLLLCKRNGREPDLRHTSLEDQLDYIKEEASILVSVLHCATECLSAEEQSVAGERGTGEGVR